MYLPTLFFPVEPTFYRFYGGIMQFRIDDVDISLYSHRTAGTGSTAARKFHFSGIYLTRRIPKGYFSARYNNFLEARIKFPNLVALIMAYKPEIPSHKFELIVRELFREQQKARGTKLRVSI